MPHVKQTTAARRSCEPRQPPHTMRSPPYTYRYWKGYDGCGLFSQIDEPHQECYRDGITLAEAEACLIWQCEYVEGVSNWWACTYYDLYLGAIWQANTPWPACMPIVWWNGGDPDPDVCDWLRVMYPECECPVGP